MIVEGKRAWLNTGGFSIISCGVIQQKERQIKVFVHSHFVIRCHLDEWIIYMSKRKRASVELSSHKYLDTNLICYESLSLVSSSDHEIDHSKINLYHEFCSMQSGMSSLDQISYSEEFFLPTVWDMIQVWPPMKAYWHVKQKKQTTASPSLWSACTENTSTALPYPQQAQSTHTAETPHHTTGPTPQPDLNVPFWMILRLLESPGPGLSSHDLTNLWKSPSEARWTEICPVAWVKTRSSRQH